MKSILATYSGTCPVCRDRYSKGAPIAKVAEGWAHEQCAIFTRNKEAVEGGSTFRSRRRSDWRRSQRKTA